MEKSWILVVACESGCFRQKNRMLAVTLVCCCWEKSWIIVVPCASAGCREKHCMLVGACAGCWEKSWILVVPCASVVLAAGRKAGC
jgi:hypothetical protein